MAKTNKQREEEWVYIIREWNKDDPYPPIRPLAKQIVEALAQKEAEVIEEGAREERERIMSVFKHIQKKLDYPKKSLLEIERIIYGEDLDYRNQLKESK